MSGKTRCKKFLRARLGFVAPRPRAVVGVRRGAAGEMEEEAVVVEEEEIPLLVFVGRLVWDV